MTITYGTKFFFGTGFPRERLPVGWGLREHPKEFALGIDPDGHEFFLNLEKGEAVKRLPPDHRWTRVDETQTVPLRKGSPLLDTRKLAAEICQAAADAFARLQPVAAAAAESLSSLGDAFYHIAARQYRAQHGRLPGSSRTARLRKKRRSKVLAWFANELRRAIEPSEP